MEKMSAPFSSFSDIAGRTERCAGWRNMHSEDREKRKSSGQGNWNMLRARDRLFDLYRGTASTAAGTVPLVHSDTGREENRCSLMAMRERLQAILDMGNLDYSTKRQEEALASCARYKIGIAQAMHKYNGLFSKYYRGVVKDVQAMNKASNLTFSSPKNLLGTIGSAMASMKSMVSMLQPMSQSLNRMNELNVTIVKMGREIGPEGSRKIFNDLAARVKGCDDLPDTPSAIGREEETPSEELSTGKFYQDWTIQNLHDGVDLLKSATESMERHCRKLKNLSLVSKAALSTKPGKQNSFSLPSSFALRAYEQEEKNKQRFAEMETNVHSFREASEMELPEILGDDLLSDPSLLASEAICRESLGKDITKLDESQGC